MVALNLNSSKWLPIVVIACALSGFCPGLGERVAGAPVSPQRAERLVRAWLKADPAPFQEHLGPEIKQVDPIKDGAGETLYFMVSMNPGGFIIVAADDWVEPIVAFSRNGRFDPSPGNPLGALVSRDLPGRVRQARKFGAKEPAGPFLKAKNKWKALEEYESSGRLVAMGVGVVSDLRVPPLVQSRWSQDVVSANYACYNYYTPPYASGDANNYPCGCSATAMAQLMRYHQHPVTSVGTTSFQISVDGVQQYRTLRGGDGAGGAYDWASMLLVVQNSTAVQRQAIGALTYDAALSLNMSFYSEGSSSDTLQAADALPGTFHYSNARRAANLGSDLGAGLVGIVNPNLDARLPVLLAVHRAGGGHAVVCDGYGYSVSTLYHHINLGWGGAEDAWYALPLIDTSPYTYTTVEGAVYNVFVTGTGEIISGRVTKTDGTALEGATVTATRTGGGTYTAMTGTNGIYALAGIPSASTYTVSVTKSGYATNSHSYSTGTSVNDAATSGNVWGANFTLSISASGPPQILQQPASQSSLAGETVTFSVTVAGGTPFFYQWQSNSVALAKQTNASLALTNVTPDMAAAYTVVISNSYGAITSAVATLSVNSEIVCNFSAGGLITLNSSGPADSYPSTITVSGLSGVVIKATVTLSNLSHTYPDDLDILLVGPRGQKVMLMSDAGNGGAGYGLNGATLTFDDAAPGYLLDYGPIVPGTYRPSAYTSIEEPTGDAMPSPAPAGPYGTNLAVFNGLDPNGVWQLFINDDMPGDDGTLANGWILRLTVIAQNQVVDHFAWRSITGSQFVNTPFAVSVTAQDAANQTLANYAGLVSLSGRTNTAILGNVVHSAWSSGGSYTDGYAFTPAEDITVTHVRHYYGDKVSIWTDAGALVASRTVTSVSGTWLETALTNPVTLYAGKRYRLGTYYANLATIYYARYDLPDTFSHGTIDGSYYSSGDRCPTTIDGYHLRWYLVDLRYDVISTPITPVTAGPFVNGVWTGQVSVPIILSNLVLCAEDPYGHSGRSNPFEVSAQIAQPLIVPDSLQMLNGAFQMRLTNLGPSGTLVMQISTNLTDWTPVFTNTVLTPPVTFSDPNASNAHHRFYRAVLK